jgi:hypothetical protein
MKQKPTHRPCLDCKISIEYIPRRTRCIECYKNDKKKETKVKFIEDD